MFPLFEKKIALMLLFFLMSLQSIAQVKNNAIEFEGVGRVSLGVIDDADKAEALTLQMWINPKQWYYNANLLVWGDNLSIQLGTTNTLKVRVGNELFTFTDSKLLTGDWSHITLIIDNMLLKIIVNNSNEQEATLSTPFVPVNKKTFLLGGGYVGRIDELRLWKTVLPTDYNRFWNNTVDRLNPSWQHIIGYWKFDQTRLATNVYDYSGNEHNGTFSNSGVKRVEVSDNKYFVYRRNLAYSDCSRFFDRGIQQGQYLKSNVISMIGATAQSDGTIKYKQPDNKGIVTNGSYLAEFKERSGILDLYGEGAQMNVGHESLIAYDNNTYLNIANNYTYMTWLYLDKWSQDAFLLKKESNNNNGISLRLGSSEGIFILRCNGVEFIYNTSLKVGQWSHIGFSTNATTLGNEFVFVVDKDIIVPSYSHTTVATTALSELKDTDCLIGVNIDGKLDETITWTQSFNANEIISQGDKPLEPGIGKVIKGAYARSVDGCWKYDISEDLGRDSYSTPEWFRMIKSVFAGYEGGHVTISIDKWADAFFSNINNNAEYREKLANSIANIGNEDFIDGVDYDFEWNNNWSGIGELCRLVREKMNIGKIQAVSPHELYYSFPKDKMQYVDYFNFQDYGPANKNIFNFDNYKSFFTKAKNYGYPVDKIMLSYATTTSGALYSNGSRPANTHTEFYPTGWRSMPYNTFEYNQNTYDVGDGLTRYFTGMEQTWLRSELMNNNGCAGIFYWDMGNDTPESDDPRSLARYASFGVNSNIQKIVNSVSVVADVPDIYDFKETTTEYFRIRGAADGHTTHYMYQNGNELFAGEKGSEVISIFNIEKNNNETNTYFIKANDGRYIQDRSELATTSSVYKFDTNAISYNIKTDEYNYPQGECCLEQTYYTPNKQGFTDVQRCLKCNGNNTGVSTWGPWTAASHWILEPVYGFDIYTVILSGIETVSCTIEGYTGSSVIYNGGFIVIPEAEEISEEVINAGAIPEGYECIVTIDNDNKNIIVEITDATSIENIETENNNSAKGIYDITGRRLKRIAAPGVYIVNGKKTLIK